MGVRPSTGWPYPQRAVSSEAGLGLAILIDVLIVRMVVAPAVMTLIAIAVHRAYPALSPDTSEAASSRT